MKTFSMAILEAVRANSKIFSLGPREQCLFLGESSRQRAAKAISDIYMTSLLGICNQWTLFRRYDDF